MTITIHHIKWFKCNSTKWTSLHIFIWYYYELKPEFYIIEIKLLYLSSFELKTKIRKNEHGCGSLVYDMNDDLIVP